MFSLHTSLKASALEDSKSRRETQRRKRSGESSRPSVVAVQLEGRGKDQRESSERSKGVAGGWFKVIFHQHSSCL